MRVSEKSKIAYNVSFERSTRLVQVVGVKTKGVRKLLNELSGGSHLCKANCWNERKPPSG